MPQFTDDQTFLLKKSFEKFLKNSTGKFVVFDLETNGFHGSSVLSISAQKCLFVRGKKVSVLGDYNRFYFPVEKFNWQAIKINGLGRTAVTAKRGSATYAQNFIDDITAFKRWCEGIEHFVGHNIIKFDCEFFPKDFKFTHVFDTMLETVELCKILRDDGKNKFPKLREAAEFFEIDISEGILHTSSFDVDVTTQLFEKLYSLT